METLSDEFASQRQLASREALSVIQHGLQWFVDVRMGMVFSKWSIGPVTRGLDWLGYRVWPTHKLLRRRSVIAAKRKIARFAKSGDALSLSRFVASWRGHAQWAHSHHLLCKLGVCHALLQPPHRRTDQHPRPV